MCKANDGIRTPLTHGVGTGYGGVGRRRRAWGRAVALAASLALLCGFLASGRVQAGSMAVRHASKASGSSALFERLGRQNVGVYERMVRMRDSNPTAFDSAHPFYASILTDRSSFNYWLNRWESNHLRFAHYHPLAWRVIAGESYMGGPPSPGTGTGSGTTPPIIPPIGQGLEPGGGTTTPPKDPAGGPTISGGAVPEPMSCVLLVSSMAVVLAARVRSRRRGRPA